MKLKEWFEENQDKEIEFKDGKLTVKEPETKGRWKPEDGDVYWFLESAWIGHAEWIGIGYHLGRSYTGNVFKTLEEAKFAAERLKIRAEMLDLGGREYFKPNEINNYISYNHDTGKLVLDGGSRFQDPFVIYFGRDVSLLDVIEKIGENRIKKYLFGIEEQSE